MGALIVIIMRGLSGSGKSTMVNKIMDALLPLGWDSFRVSADDFFMEGGEYKFDPSKLSQAHAMCMSGFLVCLEAGKRQVTKKISNGVVVFVDNTNTTVAEYTPYTLVAESQGYKPLLLEVATGIEVCKRENVHGVPDAGIEAQNKRFEMSRPWDNTRTVNRHADTQALAKNITNSRKE